MNYYYFRGELITFHLRVELLVKNLKFEFHILIDIVVDIENMYNIVVDIEDTERKVDIVKDMETNIAGNIN
jgi:cell division FtsZ-interacting protein ZapD